MIYVLYGCLAALVVAMGLVLFRLERGPGNLDRAVALDVITSASVGVIVVILALTGRIDLLPLLVIFTSIGFIGSTVIARFSQAESITERRILTPEEAEQAPEPVLADEDAPVHPDIDEAVAVVVDELDPLASDEELAAAVNDELDPWTTRGQASTDPDGEIEPVTGADEAIEDVGEPIPGEGEPVDADAPRNEVR